MEVQKAIKRLRRGANEYSAKQPASMQYSQNDISASDAGRTEDGTMHKKFVATKVKLELKWGALTTTEIKGVFTAFDFEHFTDSFDVEYLDPKEGTYTTKTFYATDRTAPLYNATLGLWESLSFSLVEI